MKRNTGSAAASGSADTGAKKSSRCSVYGGKRVLAAVLSVCIAMGPVAADGVTVWAAQVTAAGTEEPGDGELRTLPEVTEELIRSDGQESVPEGPESGREAGDADGQETLSEKPEAQLAGQESVSEEPENGRETEGADGRGTAPEESGAQPAGQESAPEEPENDWEAAEAQSAGWMSDSAGGSEPGEGEEYVGRNPREKSGELILKESDEPAALEEAPEERVLPTGLLAPEVLPLSAKEVADNEIVAGGEFLSAWKETRGAYIYNDEWDKYKNYYFYNQLDEDERALWDTLDAVCYNMLTTQINAESTTGTYHLKTVSSQALNRLQMYRVVRLFRISNPQYYFLDNVVLLGSNGFTNVIAPGVYSKFANGAVRAQETARVKSQVEAWISEVNAYPDEEQKVRRIYDLIIDRVDYNHAFVENPNPDEDSAYTQTAYSAICLPLTVCAGYSQAFGMVCNGVGIDAVSVTSENHQWNKVRINDSWYNVDLTWGDSGAGNPTSYQYFKRNDSYYDNDHPDNARAHSEETDYVTLSSGTGIPMWVKGSLPVCNLDSAPVVPYTAPGSVPAVTETTAAPEIGVKRSDGEIEVTIRSTTPGAMIYYSLNEKAVPSPGSTKCERYTDSFVLEKGAKIQAVAVCDGRFDSTAVQKSVEVRTVKFNGNGSDSGSMNSVMYLPGSGQKLPANKFQRKYYTFAGWNTKKDGKGTSYSDKQVIAAFPSGSGSTVTLYAQWKKTAYKITYHLNGGKNNGKNPATYTHWTATIKLKNPTRTGYKFGGWYKDKKCTKKVTEIKKGGTENVTLYAKWTANQYQISFNGNGSTSGTMKALASCKYGKSYKLAANKFRRTGYTFAGWNTKKNGKGKSYSDKQSVKNLTSKAGGKVTLYAQWKKTSYKITYHLNGGKNNSKNPDSYTYTTATIKLKNPTRKGYTFVGWYSDKKCTKKVTQIKKGSTGKVTLYAKWKKK